MGGKLKVGAGLESSGKFSEFVKSSQGSTSLNPPELQANQSFETSFSDPAGELVSDRHSPPVELVTFRGTKFCDCQTAESR